MNVDPWILGFSLVTVLATVWMGFWAAGRSRTASDFFVAGRGVSVGWNASAISGEYLSAASFMGIAGMAMSSGYDALWYPVCYACGYLFLLLFIAGPLRRFGAYTIPDFAEGRYDSPGFRKIAVVFVLFIGFFYTMPQMKGAGTTLAYIFPGLPYWIGVVLVGGVITLNVALGGMKGITLVQAFQYWAKMFAISVPVFVLLAVYGGYGTQVARNTPGWVNLREPNAAYGVPPTFGQDFSLSDRVRLWGNRVGLAAIRFWPQSKGELEMDLNQVLSIYACFSGTRVYVVPPATNLVRVWGGPSDRLSPLELKESIERTLASNRLAVLRTEGAIYVAKQDQAASLIDPVPSNRKALPDKAPPDRAWRAPFGPLTTKAPKAASLSEAESRPYALLYTYSLIIALVCGTAGLPHILVRFYTNPDGVAAKRTTMWVMILIGVFYVFPPVFGVLGRNLMPELYVGTGAKGTDKIVLELPRILNERYGVLGSILSGITCAGAFAAFMSTFSGLLVSMTGALAHDVYGRILRPHSSPADRMRMFKVFAWVIGGVATFLGCFVEPLQINFMVGQAFAIAAASYFPLLFMSVWWRGMTMRGAASGMLAGGVAAVVAVSLTNFSDLGWLPWKSFWAAHPLLRILFEQPAIWAVPGAILTMLVVSKLTRRSVPSDIRMKMLVLHAPEALGLKQEYIREHEAGH